MSTTVVLILGTGLVMRNGVKAARCRCEAGVVEEAWTRLLARISRLLVSGGHLVSDGPVGL